MKFFTLLLFATLFSFNSFAQETTEIVQTLANSSMNIKVALEGQIKVTEWENDYIQVSTKIELSNARKGILKHLIAANRYRLTDAKNDGILIIEAPKTKKRITIKGKELSEAYEYEVFVPKSSEVQLPELKASAL